MKIPNEKVFHEKIRQAVSSEILAKGQRVHACHYMFGDKALVVRPPSPNSFRELSQIWDQVHIVADSIHAKLYTGVYEVFNVKPRDEGLEIEIGCAVITQYSPESFIGTIYRYVFDKNGKVTDLLNEPSEKVDAFLKASNFNMFR